MKTNIQHLFRGSILAASALVFTQCANDPITKANASHASGSAISRDSRAALDKLYARNSTARRLGQKAAGVLVFPEIVRGGFIFGAEGGNGALFSSSGKTTAYYETGGASMGLQAGVEKFGYALFLMKASDVKDLDRANGWDVGSSPSLVVVDQGVAADLSTKSMDKGIYAFCFDQKGLMANLSLKGSKITRIHPGP